MDAKSFFETKNKTLPYLRDGTGTQEYLELLETFQDNRFTSLLEVYHTPEGKQDPEIVKALYIWAGVAEADEFIMRSERLYKEIKGFNERIYSTLESLRKSRIKRLATLRREVKLPPEQTVEVISLLKQLINF